LGPEGRPTQAVGHTCSGNLWIVKILRYIKSDKFKIAIIIIFLVHPAVQTGLISPKSGTEKGGDHTHDTRANVESFIYSCE
jgi:hypothetical protein